MAQSADSGERAGEHILYSAISYYIIIEFIMIILYLNISVNTNSTGKIFYNIFIIIGM